MVGKICRRRWGAWLLWSVFSRLSANCYVTLRVTLRYMPYLILQISYFSQNRSRFLYRLNQLFAVLKHTRIAENRSIITQHDISRPLTPEATDWTLSWWGALSTTLIQIAWRIPSTKTFSRYVINTNLKALTFFDTATICKSPVLDT